MLFGLSDSTAWGGTFRNGKEIFKISIGSRVQGNIRDRGKEEQVSGFGCLGKHFREGDCDNVVLLSALEEFALNRLESAGGPSTRSTRVGQDLSTLIVCFVCCS